MELAESSLTLGKNKLLAILATISSSKPRIASTLFSIHCAITAALTLVRSTSFAKEDGNFVERSSLFCAAFDAIDAVPLIEGMT